MDKKEAQFKKMTEEPVSRLILSLAVPTIISMMVTAIYNTADTYFVSQLGTSASGAVGIVMSLMGIIQSSGFLIGMGAGSWMSRLLGEKKEAEASEVAASGFYFSLLMGVLIAVLGVLFLEPLVLLLGATETIRPYAMEYAQYILYAAPFLIASFSLNKMLCAEGKARFAMVGIASGGILNIFLDPLFIFVFHMGIAGAAVATALSQVFSFVLLLYMFVSGRTIAKLNLKNASRRIMRYVQIVKYGMPSFFRQGLSSVAMIAMNIQAAKYGDSAVSAMAIVTKVFMLIFSVVIGFGQGYQPVAGYNYGAKFYGRVKESFLFMTKTATLFLCIFAAAGYFAAPSVICLFIKDDPEVIRIGTETMRFQCVSMPFLPLAVCCNMTFQTIGKSAVATFLASARQGYAFLPLVLILPRFLGMRGVEISQPLADVIAFFICIPFTVRFFRELALLQESAGK
ncbi:MAG: MATE family efflux transporter [Lachnospiraceae bacterium]|nr:MATE family efflux transporter [Lachnospiraceae bacterium]